MTEFCVIGQSNSIMRDGFVQRLIGHGRHTMRTGGRIGASPSILAPFFVNRHFISGSDFCIVDTCVVDAAAMHNGAIDPLNIIEYLRFLVHTCRRANCQPIFVIIPPLTLFSGSYAERYFYAIYESVIKSERCFYLDARAVISALAQEMIVSKESLYKDPSHIGDEVSEKLATLIEGFFDLPNHQYRTSHVEYLNRSFRRVNVCESAPSEFARVSHNTSLIEFSGLRLERGQQLIVHTGTIQRVHGMFINSASSFSKVIISGDIRVAKNLNLRAYSSASTFEARLIPICSPLADGRCKIRIDVCDNDCITNDATMQERLDFNDRFSHVELADIIVEDSFNVESYVSAIPIEGTTDLFALR